jgi:beta-glucosidase
MKQTAVFLLSLLLSAGTLWAQDLRPLEGRKEIPAGAAYANPALPASVRAADLLHRLTFDEKLKLTGGWKGMFFPGVERLGLRPVRMSDATQGVHLKPNYLYMKNGRSTSYPAFLSVAATWNPALPHDMGRDVGEECHAFGVDILLGPGINMYRVSENGRNFEYLGEDPILTSRMVVPYVKGLQGTGIIATAKHYLCNDQEVCRHIASSDVDMRTLREIYLPPWKAAIKEAGMKAIMTGNNLVNSVPCSMDKSLTEDILRKEYGFRGIAMTDWQNTCYHPNKQNLVLPSGESLLMSNNDVFAGYIRNFLKAHPGKKDSIEQRLDTLVYHNLLPVFEMGIYDRKPVDSSYFKTFAQHKVTCCRIGDEAITLLKNEGHILPLAKGTKILLTGGAEVQAGKGSGYIEGYDHVSFARGLAEVYGKNLTVNVHPTDAEVKAADVVLYRLNKEAGEGHDIPFGVPQGVKDIILHLVSLNPNVVVLVSACNGLDLSWLPKVKAVLWCYFLGQERGHALADVLSGKVNPSGHLPFTLEKKFSDSPDPDYNYIGGKPYWCGSNPCYKRYWLGLPSKKKSGIAPYIKPHEVFHIPYKEGVFIGYRWYQKNHIPVWFPFGYGLSYTTFRLNGLKLSSTEMSSGKPVTVSLTLTNTGKKAGAEVVQLYIGEENSRVERPEKELKHFQKVFLNPGESRKVSFTLTPQDLAYWNTPAKKWTVDNGVYYVLVGTSSADI